MVSRKFSFVFICLLLFETVSFGQDVRAVARVDSNMILIGDWLTLYLDVQHPANVTITGPSLPDSLEGFEIVHRNAPTVKKDGQNALESFSFIVTAFDSGLHVIPPFMFRYAVAGDTTQRGVETSPIPIFVRGVAVDTTREIKDVKPPLGVPLSFAEILPYLIGVVGIAGIIWLIYYITKKRRKGEKLIPESPPRPAHEVALEALRSLESERLWQRGKVKEYYSQLTDIVRSYIERRFNVLAMEMTTDEILSSPAITLLPHESTSKLKEILVRADFVKFAKLQPVAEENEASLPLAISFVESTWHEVSESTTSNLVEEVRA